MKVRAKFVVYAVTEFKQNKNVELMAVTATTEENKSFSKYTPSGKINITIDKGTDAVDFFVPGEEIYLTFEKAE